MKSLVVFYSKSGKARWVAQTVATQIGAGVYEVFENRKNNLLGKKVAVFFTQGNKKPQAIDETKALMPNCNYLGELALVTPLANKEECKKQIIFWCKTSSPLS